jgi:hypothetical protein
VNGPARSGDLYRFDMYSNDPYGRPKIEHFCIDATDDGAALYEAEYVLNIDTHPPVGATGKLWRVDSGTDRFVADIGPLDFGGRS